MDATVTPLGTCQPGFEPDPNNPTLCVKKCPAGYKPFGSLCVQNCLPPYTETGVPNECVPDSQPARMVSPTTNGTLPQNVPYKVGPAVSNKAPSTVDWTLFLTVSIVVAIGALALVGLLLNGVVRRK